MTAATLAQPMEYRVAVLTVDGAAELRINDFPGPNTLLRVVGAAESTPGVLRVDTVSAVIDRQ